MPPSTICLNMIVKNESHIIRGTLEMLCSKIRFDYWVICDTGSTDSTREIIREFFSEKHIQGELHCDEWVNFAHNRTKALEYAYNKTDLLLVFDADDELHGTIRIPEIVSRDEYQLKFGMPKSGMSYVRTLLINNRKRFKYFSVLHEFISCQEPSLNEQNRSCILEGDYYVVSGRSGSRNLDPDKYLKDANILASAHAEALAKGDDLYKRYSFYCANSFRDCGKYEDAIRWYKITLSQDNWAQEKYLSCLYIYQCYELMKQKEHGFYYLVKAFAHDAERVECFYPLLVHYCCEGMNDLAYNYYRMLRMWPKNDDNKLFVETDKIGFFVPYYMIIVADRIGDRECGILMYKIIFTQKHRTFSVWHLRNLVFNLSFFIGHVKAEEFNAFAALANSYIDFVINNGVPANTFDDLINILNSRPKSKLAYSLESKLKCKNSRNILFYAGYGNMNWNYSHMKHRALGGSEKAVAYLSKELGLLLGSEKGDSYTIYVAGNVQAEELPEYNLKYVGLADLPELLSKTEFHTVICSRYISFLEIYGPACSFYQFYIWAHDTRLLAYGCDLRDITIIEKWSDHINGCVCQTKWHADHYANIYPILKSKISIINNGIDLELFPQPQPQIQSQLQENSCKPKQPSKFIYTSRTERGLARILEMWPQIVAALPDATLAISTYEVFPCNDDERRIQAGIESLNQEFPLVVDNAKLRIQHLGQLNTAQLYSEMSTAEYWLYPTDWPETSCITAMEMLMSEVICLYYPGAGLTNTMGECGIQISPGTEIQSLTHIAHDEGAKEALRKQGRAYAESCAWVNRAISWKHSMFGAMDKLDKIDRIYYINLERRRDRREHFENQCKIEGIPMEKVQRFEAIDGTTCEFSDEQCRMFTKCDYLHTPYVKKIMANQLGHYYILKEMIATQCECIIVLQDDVIFKPGFIQRVQNVLSSVPENAEIVNIGLYQWACFDQSIPWVFKDDDREAISKQIINDEICIWNDGINPCSLAYIVTMKGAINLVNHFDTTGFLRAADHNFNDYLRNRNIFYGSTTILCTGNSNLGSDIFCNS